MSQENISKKRKSLFVFLLLIICFFVVEFGLHLAQTVFLFGYLKSERQRELDNRRTLAVYKDAPWAKEYYDEIYKMKPTIDPLVGWRPEEIHGAYVNVDAEGVRKTWNPAVSSIMPQAKVFMFGASTTWGAGARDLYTIPSLVSKLLNSESAKNGSYRVTNYGQSGYVLVQEIAKLTYLLEKGERPDYVIFYDGANDISYAYESGVPGPAGSAAIIRDQIEGRLSGDISAELTQRVKNAVREECFACRIAVGAIRKFSPRFLNPNVVAGQSYSGAELRRLAGEIAAAYKNETMPFLQNLSRAFGFKLLMFWQPTIYTESKLIGQEKLLGSIDPHVNDANASTLYREVNAILPSDPAHNFYNLTYVLSARQKEYYIDYAHISEEGNGIVAQKIVQILEHGYSAPAPTI